VRPLKDTPTAELLAVADRHRVTLARDPGNKFCAKAIVNITAELEARK
jgi:hypothetical protein